MVDADLVALRREERRVGAPTAADRDPRQQNA
jgi:hypothetical protein